jgi:hypothetical protein
MGRNSCTTVSLCTHDQQVMVLTHAPDTLKMATSRQEVQKYVTIILIQNLKICELREHDLMR